MGIQAGFALRIWPPVPFRGGARGRRGLAAKPPATPQCQSVRLPSTHRFLGIAVRKGLSATEANGIVRDFFEWQVVENTLSLLEAALDYQQRWQVSLWDALILAAAHHVGASELIREDFSNGQDYGGVIARNPFMTLEGTTQDSRHE